MEDKKLYKEPSSRIDMQDRRRLCVTGVIDVDNFNSDNVLLDTELGVLQIKGADLRINKLNIESQELIVEGEIDSFAYVESSRRKSNGGLFANLFK